MQQRGEGRQSVKRQGTTAPKARTKARAKLRRKARTATAPTIADFQEQVGSLNRQLKEALERQTATAEVLQIINRSSGNMVPVFDAILEKAHSLCGVTQGSLQLYDGTMFRAVALRGISGPFVDRLRQGVKLNPNAPGPHLLEGARFVHIHDLGKLDDPMSRAAFELAGIRTILFIPLRKDGVLLGRISASRQEVRPFTEKEISLLEEFAAQAVIAIENARLFNETREALEQQTATSEVLQVISSSTGDVQPVFQKLLENATRVCGAEFGVMNFYEDGMYRDVATYNVPPAFAKSATNKVFRPHPESGLARIVRLREVIQTEDLRNTPGYREGTASSRDMADLAGARTIVNVPMVRDNDLIGTITIFRQEVRPFTDKQLELLKNFASQAVIAIENTRLLNELRARTEDLSESLQQQTAASEVLKVVSSSVGELEPVFAAMLASAARICDVRYATIFLREGAVARLVSKFGPPLGAPVGDRVPLDRDFVVGRTIIDAKTIHVRDLANSDEFPRGRERALRLSIGNRATLGVPLVRDGAAIGAIVLRREEAVDFTPKQIELVANFANQAVIAIENTRLLKELRARTNDLSESLQQQTATTEVLQVINSSPGDVAPVFEAMLEKALNLCEASFGVLCTYDGDSFQAAALRGVPARYAEFLRSGPLRPGPGNGLARLVAGERVVHALDVAAEGTYRSGEAMRRALVDLGGARTTVTLPLLKDSKLLGAFIIFRQEVRPFTEKQIALAQNFAAQAVIAIENTRLLKELRARTDDLSESLQQQTATSDVLKIVSSSPGQLEPVFKAVLSNATHLCNAQFGTLLRYDGNAFYFAADVGTPAALAEYVRRPGPFQFAPGGLVDRILTTRQMLHLADYAADASPGFAATLGGARSTLGVPIMKDEVLYGALIIYRQEVRPFSEREAALVQSFAAQAAIAIENARLINETKEALERQTATADILKVIASSPSDVQPVFEAIAERANRLVSGRATAVHRIIDGQQHLMAFTRISPQADAVIQATFPRPLDVLAGAEQLSNGEVFEVTDTERDFAKHPGVLEMTRKRGARSIVIVPLMRDSKLMGLINVSRGVAGRFDTSHVSLLRTFADQAVIAIENARLFNETKEALERQTATSEVLKVISASPGELDLVFQSMLENAVRLCEAQFAMLFLSEGDQFRVVGRWNLPPAYREFLANNTIPFDARIPVVRAAVTKQPVQVPDMRADQSYIERVPVIVAVVELGGARTLLQVPMLKEDVLVGTVAVYRQEVRPFTDKQVALVQNFAAQGVIAIENARLLNELRQRTADLSRSLEDLRTAQDRLVQTEKLASLGQLTAGIAHEIKNPLNFVNNFSALSAELIDEMTEVLENPRLDEIERQKELAEIRELLKSNLEKVVQHGKRADSIVKNMLLHSRQGTGEQRPVEINTLIDESLNLAYHGARAEKQGFNITLERDFDPTAGVAEVFPQEITRVLLNMISNGFYAATKHADAAGNGFEPIVKAATRDLGDRVEIRIRDNGTGIPAEVKEKIFNPFFTTKPAGEGTGLGLSMSHDIVVKQHRGTIDVVTEPGVFTEFIITLPRNAQTQNPAGGAS